MKQFPLIASLILLSLTLHAQVVFKTIIPVQAVVAGESFPIQYVLEDVEKSEDFTPPAFTGFRLVSGPYTYNGSIYNVGGYTSVKNIVYTLVATRPGSYFIKGASVKVNGRYINSDDVTITVISKSEAMQKARRQGKPEIISEDFLRPDEDPYEKIQKNLFMKVSVDRRDCYVGQPVVATFKLYSRLTSSSDIIKNPGFYGFAVHDIVSLDDKVTISETIDGKSFDVHIVRTVQLYPLQPGLFSIDPMEVANKVEFSKSAVNKKSEQQVTEGGILTESPPASENIVVYESSISTEKIDIRVKPYPEKNKPPVFNGATGRFTIQAEWEKNDLAKNEEGALLITISGKGNFTQLSAPAVGWPAGVEAFEPIIKDSLDKTHAPLKGSRIFRFPFVGSRSGSYTISAVSFPFFDPDSNRYKIVTASAPEIRISNEIKPPTPAIEKTNGVDKKRFTIHLWKIGAVLAIIAIISSLFYKKRNKEVKTEMPTSVKTTGLVSIHELLQPAQFAMKAEDRRFYDLLQKSIWDYLSMRLQLSGSTISKPGLYKAMRENHFNEEHCRSVISILQQCEAAVFTKAEFVDDKEELFDKAKAVLELINRQ